MDNMLCDELVQEIFTRLPSSSSASLSVSLVSKRWLHLYRTSRTSLSLQFTNEYSTITCLSSLLSHYPFLSHLSLLLSTSSDSPNPTNPSFSDHLLFLVSCFCSKLRHLRFITGPVSLFSLLSLSKSCIFLTSLTISLSRPVFLKWVVHFSCLRELSVFFCSENGYRMIHGSWEDEEIDSELNLESLCLSGVFAGDEGLGWLYRSCKNLKKLKLKSCEGVGDGGLYSSFVHCLQGLVEVELRTCRSIVDGVLLKLAENCCFLNSLLVYDGGSRDALLQFITNSRSRSSLQKLDLRLPLDLKNDHLLAVAMNFRGLSCLRLQSSCLVTGEGLKTIGMNMSSELNELALINCDVVEREAGLLATLGQNLKCLKKLDLSYNESLRDKEMILMLVSCSGLVELKLKGCKGLKSAALVTMFRSCKSLEDLDIMHCCGIDTEAVESFVLNSPRLRRLQVEENKLSDVAKTWASSKYIEFV